MLQNPLINLHISHILNQDLNGFKGWMDKKLIFIGLEDICFPNHLNQDLNGFGGWMDKKLIFIGLEDICFPNHLLGYDSDILTEEGQSVNLVTIFRYSVTGAECSTSTFAW